jgi:ribosome-associated protein
LELALAAARVAEEDRGLDIQILDTRELTSMFDFFVIASGASRRQMHAMAEEIDDILKRDFGEKRLGIEGYVESKWILLDYGDVVVHLFDPEARQYYQLEQLWSDARRVEFEPSAPRIAPR